MDNNQLGEFLTDHEDVIEAEVVRMKRSTKLWRMEDEDLKQICRIAAFKALPRLPTTSEPTAYLRRVCRSALVRHIKTSSRDLLATAVSLSNIKEP